jgi:hypothetical protein
MPKIRMTTTAPAHGPPLALAASRRARAAPRWIGLGAGALCLALGAPSAQAQTRTEDRVAAESLFSDGRRLMQAGDYSNACPKLEASRRLEGALGTTLNLGHCYEQLGRTASAWAEFRSAAAEAQKGGDAARKATALERAAALEPRLSRLQINSIDPSVSVLRNGEPVSAAIIGSAIPVDPGSYELEAHAPGKLAWQRSITVEGEGATVAVDIPNLDNDPAAAPSTAATTPEPPVMSNETNPAGQTWAWVLGGVGVASVAAGTTFAVLAVSNWSKAEEGCRDLPYECSSGAVGRAEDANTFASLATVGLAVGGAALGASLVLFLTSSETSGGAELAITPRALTLRGKF